jgi:O-antigen ligase
MSWVAVATLALVSWGALAFGAVYPWAFRPLFLGSAVVGLAALLQRGPRAPMDVRLATALALIAAAMIVQLLPVHADILRRLSPETDNLLRRYVFGYPVPNVRHALSVRPAATALALMAFGALALLLLGMARALTHRDVVHVARGVAIVGAILASIGLAQRAMWNGRIYGFWKTIDDGNPFGPFVNRNHFAGWMLMALPLVLGYFFGRLGAAARRSRSGWREWFVWLSSTEANEITLIGFAIFLMALSITMTMSRSGLAGLFAAVTITGWFVVRRQTGSRRAFIVAYLCTVVIAAAWLTGVDRLAAQFSSPDGVDAASRFSIWRDAWHLATLFPIAGTGLDTFGTMTIFYQTWDPSIHFAEAHNDYLQLLAEGGVLVAVPAIIAIGVLAAAIRRRFRDSSSGSGYWMRLGAVTALVAIALQEVVDFSLQMPGNAVLFVVLLAIAVRPSGDMSTGAASVVGCQS